MKQKIRYMGLSLTPDELAADNGTLAVCANAELHAGALRPSVMVGTKTPNPLVYTPTGMSGTKQYKKLIYVHKTSAYTHLIAVHDRTTYEGSDTSYNSRGERLCWFDEDGQGYGELSNFDYNMPDNIGRAKIVQVESIGNTLMVLATNGIHYVLWKQSMNNGAGGYKYLGRKPPFVPLSFSLGRVFQADYDRSTVEQYDPSSSFTAFRRTSIDPGEEDFEVAGTRCTFIKEELKHDITQEAWALINQTHDLITKSGNFYTNFSVRYCYRLYDGSMVMHSAPIFIPVGLPNSVKVGFRNLMYAESDVAEYDSTVTITDNNGHNTTSQGKILLSYMPYNAPLMMRCEDASAWSDLKSDWSDIVKSLDIFVSPPFLKVKDSEPVNGTTKFTYSDGVRIVEGVNDGRPTVIANNFSSALFEAPSFVLNIPEISDNEYLSKIRENSVFYKVRSYKISTPSLPSSYTDLQLRDTLPTLTSQEAMTDDYKSHNILLPVLDGSGEDVSKLYVYNNRLNFSAVREMLFGGFQFPGGLAVKCSDDIMKGTISLYDIIYTINTEDGEKYVKTSHYGTTVSVYCLCHSLIFYPDARATKATVYYIQDGRRKNVSITMSPCTSIYGSIGTIWGIYDFTGTEETNQNTFAQPAVDSIVSMSNKIYTSEAGNPFIFPPTSINTVGTGTVIGMAANTRALTQGQFGQFPLLAFATDGIWALDVSATGTFSTIHPISREVCSNPNGICQIDQQVIFATVRGLYSIVEQNVEHISAELDGPFLPLATIAPRLADIGNVDGWLNTTHKEELRYLSLWNESPIDFMQAAKVLYDFASNRLILARTRATAGIDNALVYSLRDRTWSTMTTDSIFSVVNGYPHAYIQDTSGYVTCLDKRYPFDDASVPAKDTLIVTRALSFGDAMYTINDVLHNKMVAASTYLFMFGSNDLKTWSYIGMTNQTHVHYLPSRAWRYYRFAIYNSMKPGEKYISTSFNVYEKFGKV